MLRTVKERNGILEITRHDGVVLRGHILAYGFYTVVIQDETTHRPRLVYKNYIAEMSIAATGHPPPS